MSSREKLARVVGEVLEDLVWRAKAGLTVEPSISAAWAERIRAAAGAVPVVEADGCAAALEAADVIGRERWLLSDPDVTFLAAQRIRTALDLALISFVQPDVLGAIAANSLSQYQP